MSKMMASLLVSNIIWPTCQHGEQSRIDDGCGESRGLPAYSQEQVECTSVSQCFNFNRVSIILTMNSQMVATASLSGVLRS